jgi:hypothetical protein
VVGHSRSFGPALVLSRAVSTAFSKCKLLELLDPIVPSAELRVPGIFSTKAQYICPYPCVSQFPDRFVKDRIKGHSTSQQGLPPEVLGYRIDGVLWNGLGKEVSSILRLSYPGGRYCGRLSGDAVKGEAYIV